MFRRALATLAASALALTLGAAASPAAYADSPQQWRSYWADAFNEGIYNPAQVTKLVQAAQDINANALIVQTVRRYDCFCNRAVYPRTDAFVDPAPYDPLDAVIAEAHAAELEVHAWVNVGTMWNSSTPHSSPDHVFNAHGPSATGADRWLNKRADGAELIGANAFMDLMNPAAVDYIVAAIQSILREYDVDGINLDYIRFPDYNSSSSFSDWGYSETSIARFQAATGRSDNPDPSDQEFLDWRRQQITNLVRKIYLGMWEVDPQARLSMDGITYGFGPQSVGGWESTRTYAEVLQDWKGWLAEGIMDTVVGMNYKRNWVPAQEQMYAEWKEVLADWQGDRQAVVGPALYLNEISDSLAQASAALEPTAAGNTAAGWSGYSFANPSLTGLGQPPAVRDAQRALLAEALTTGENAPFAEQAAVPVMPWKANPTDGHISGQVALHDSTPLDQVAVTLRPLTASGGIQTGVTDGSGWFGFVHLEPGLYLVQLELPEGVVGAPVALARVSTGNIDYVTMNHLFRL